MCSLKHLFNFYVFCACVVINCEQLYLNEGESCNNGVCQLLRNCPSAITAIKRWEHPQICSFPGLSIEPIVCCPQTYEPQLTNNISGKRISEEKCEEYSKIYVTRATSIVGGVAALLGEFPYMAAIGYGDENNTSWLCGGTLISERYVLTAAHCTFARDFGDARFVRVGDLNLVKDIDDAQPQNFRVEQTIQHPLYKPPVIYHDIALIKLDKNVKFEEIRPACLYITTDIMSGYATATGWGVTELEGLSSDDLMKVSLEIFTQDKCNQSYSLVSDRRTLPNGILNEYQVCAGSSDSEKDSCQGDSGGPLQIFDVTSGAALVVGITSFGKACGVVNSPGVYTRVSAYVPWIESIVWKT